MGLFENWPYSNLHDLNLDTLVALVQQMEEDLEELKARIEALEEAEE